MNALSLVLAAQLFVGVAALAQPPAAPKQAPAPVAAAVVGPYHVVKTFEIGGEGGWDCLVVDSDAKRLYVPRSTRVIVIDTETGKQVGEIADTPGVHDVALAPQLGKGFTSNGRGDSVTVFDLKTFKAIKTVKAGGNPDAIIFEPVTKRVFCFNGKSNDVTVINAEDLGVIATIPLGGKPELAVVDEKGSVFLNIEDKDQIVRIDAAKVKVEQYFPIAPAAEPSGLAIDTKNHLLFAVGANEMMAVVDSESGKVLATPAIGKGVDGAAFDPAGFAISSNGGDGTITVISTTGDKPFSVAQTLTTARGASTIVFDPKTRMSYLPTAELEPLKEGEKGRPKMKPGTFKIVVVGP